MAKTKKQYPQVIWQFLSQHGEAEFRVVAASKNDSFLEVCDDNDFMGDKIWTPINNQHVNDLTIAIADYFLQQHKKAKK